MIDPKMNYCLACDDEYVPGIKKCGVCGAELQSGAELLAAHEQKKSGLESRRGVLTADDDIVTIIKASHADLKRLESQLKAENIGTMIFGDLPSCGKGCCGGGELELRVRREDAKDAIAILEADFERSTAIGSHSAVADYGFNPALQENTCPACGCSFSKSATCPDCGLCFG